MARAAIRLDELLTIRDALDAAIDDALTRQAPIDGPVLGLLFRARALLLTRFALEKLVEVDIATAPTLTEEVPS